MRASVHSGFRFQVSSLLPRPPLPAAAGCAPIVLPPRGSADTLRRGESPSPCLQLPAWGGNSGSAGYLHRRDNLCACFMSDLNRSITPIMLWAMGVGCAFAGLFFGWNLGLARGGTLGLGLALIVVSILYLTFTLSYAELSCAIPRAGGAMSYADRALGRTWGFWAGMAQNVELIFAPPAIAFAIGAYLHLFAPQLPTLSISFGAYLFFT